MSERRAFAALGLACALAAGFPDHSVAQTLESVATECSAADPFLHPLCLEGALALQAARGGVGLAASQGAPVPGSTSTVGRRIGSSPRIAVSVRGSATRGSMPDPRNGSAPAGGHNFFPKTIEGDVAVGVFDGFSPIPTMGGVFSIDLLASIAAIGLSDQSGFDGSLQALGYGVRLGLLRESFTLPGVSVSASRRHFVEASWGEDSDRVSFVFRPTVTSLRAVAGKDLLSFGVLVGAGWERYGGRSTLTARQTIAGITHTGTSSTPFTSDRQLVFGGLSYTFLVLQLSGEGGYAKGWAQPAGRGVGGWDPTGGSLFGSVAARLTW